MRAILVNIFGGIMRCDVIAAGVVAAAREIGMRKPVIIRLQGTNVAQAKALLAAAADFKCIVADDLEEAAAKAVRIAEIVQLAGEVKVDVTFGGQ